MSSKRGKEPSSSKEKNGKRVDPPRRVNSTAQFRKDWEDIKGAGRQDLSRAKAGMMLLVADDAPMPPEYKDHPLKGPWSRYREFHAGGDLLVVYRVDGDLVDFVRIGTHTGLFD
ncbi:MAG: type II toxin-antitoxin system YafQ family toxin [Pseudomonadota bacterium]|nr:type II toxin-antitoxin system YafQ family toxin [Pseudomonadota bacterium]